MTGVSEDFLKINSKIWKIAPKTVFCGSEIINIAAYFAVCTYNDGASNVLEILKQLNIIIDPMSLKWSEMSNDIRVAAADRRNLLSTKESRIETRMNRKAVEDLYQSREGTMYKPGID